MEREKRDVRSESLITLHRIVKVQAALLALVVGWA
jgi:hypothetical protein